MRFFFFFAETVMTGLCQWVAVCIVGLLVECNGVVVLVDLVRSLGRKVGDLCACCGEEN